MSEYGIKISKEGFSVGDCTDRDLVFSSDFRAWSVHTEGTGITDGSGQAVISHGLGYVPAFDAWRGVTSPDTTLDVDSIAYADSSNLYIYTYAGQFYKYKIYTTKII